jgi:2-oxo-4-hydroxy-4-carboxy-5-ureidoimidazoline decarboxylase
MGMPEEPDAGPAGPLARLNALGPDAARAELLTCCSSVTWADLVAAARPYPSVDAVLARSDAVVAAMTTADLAGALAGHPRIGERPAPDAAWSRHEQSGVLGAEERITRALAEGNAAYERQFGHIYLVCASGRSAAELLELLEDRLDNDPETEWGVVRTELAKINQIRLRKLLADPA